MRRRAPFARGASSVFEVLRDLEAEGYTEDMTARAGGHVRCGACGDESAAGEFRTGELRRVEGASDPGDMSAVLGITCPRCRARGVLVVMYGPEAGADDSDVLAALPDPEETNTAPADDDRS